MRSARQSAVRLLQLMLVASIVLPLMLFSFAGWQNYRHEQAVADDRIERSLDILHEHTLKVFQTVERSIAEVNEIVRGMPDEEIRGDGKFLARYPEQPQRMRTLGPGSGLETAIAQGWERATYTIRSQADGTERRIGYRKLEGFPVYVIAGLETSAIRAEWATTMASHLVFGVPATLFILLIIAIALRRTRRLYDEAQRREAAEGALRQGQRLEAIGHVTGGLAHDVNNRVMI